MDASGHYKSARTLSLLIDLHPNARVHERHPDHQPTAAIEEIDHVGL
jgi:hypothetical protein